MEALPCVYPIGNWYPVLRIIWTKYLCILIVYSEYLDHSGVTCLPHLRPSCVKLFIDSVLSLPLFALQAYMDNFSVRPGAHICESFVTSNQFLSGDIIMNRRNSYTKLVQIWLMLLQPLIPNVSLQEDESVFKMLTRIQNYLRDLFSVESAGLTNAISKL